jgi:hypothetical protein
MMLMRSPPSFRVAVIDPWMGALHLFHFLRRVILPDVEAIADVVWCLAFLDLVCDFFALPKIWIGSVY